MKEVSISVDQCHRLIRYANDEIDKLNNSMSANIKEREKDPGYDYQWPLEDNSVISK